MKKKSTGKPDRRADIAVKALFLQLYLAIARNEKGVRIGTDPECLHKFRVAVRRTRALLGQIKGVLPKRRIARFSKDFAWLADATSVCRDLDVYILSFEQYKATLPVKMRNDLDPLYHYLCRQRHIERERLLRALDTKRYQRLKDDWLQYLKQPAPKHSKLAYAESSIAHVASGRIWRIYRKAVKQGKRIGARSPADAFHKLRKTCKKLRYLNEFFGGLYPDIELPKLIGILKDLQDNLGEYQDLRVQQVSLVNYIQAMERYRTANKDMHIAMESMVKKFEQRRLKIRKRFFNKFKRFASVQHRSIYQRLSQYQD